jgi:hypothetical protein
MGITTGGAESWQKNPSFKSTELDERSPEMVSKIYFAKFGVSYRAAK